MRSLATVLLLRHATAQQGRPGGRDAERPLTDHGRLEASGVGAFLRQAGLRVDHVLCSPAARTRETLEQLEVGTQSSVELVPDLYGASAEELIGLLDGLDAGTVLVVGHAPAVPDAVALLADPAASSATALAAVSRRYPPGTLARLSVGGPGPAAGTAALVGLRVPVASSGTYFE